MNVYKDISHLPSFRNAVVTIGTFDGVHCGHRQIIQQLKEEAERINGETVLITFHPHPRKVVGDTSGVKLLTTLEEKIELLEAEKIDHLVIAPFNEAFANQTAEAYVEDFLYKRFNPHTLIIGYDHRFGKKRKGDYHLLEAYGDKLGFVVKEIPEQVLQEAAISSTRIRKALLQADITIAHSLLGYDYFFEGIVIEGDKLGRTLGYPTANLQLNNEEKLVPGDGVYAVSCELQAISYKGMMYIGSRPVVNGKRRVIEVNIFDFDAAIYGETLRVTIKHFIRGDMHFDSLEALRDQLAIDKVSADG
jgi:riboflavin kinase/FMN adenylyltransferase